MSKCPECPAGLPLWLATYGDLITLLMTFFVLLYATSQQDAKKFEAVAGSIRNAFGGNARNLGEVIQLGKAPDDAPTMLDAQDPAQPFPIDFLTSEGLLDKLEMNRESDEDLGEFKTELKAFDLQNSVEVSVIPEGVKVKVKDKIEFNKGSIAIDKVNTVVLEQMINMIKEKDFSLFISAHAEAGETGAGMDAYSLSAKRAEVVTRYLIAKGIAPDKITTIFYGDKRPEPNINNRRVEFMLRKMDLRTEGKKVRSE
jgi:chemotaxis protein MotB